MWKLKKVSTKPDKGKKSGFSLMGEIGFATLELFLGSVVSRPGFALLSLLAGIAVLVCPIVDENGKELEKSIFPYLIGSAFIILSIFLIFSWLKKRNNS